MDYDFQLRRLLVIKPSSLGDIVHGLQIMQTVARAVPDCRITWIARDRFAALVEAAPFIHEVIHFRRNDGIRGFLALMETLYGRSFDAVWDMQGLLRSALMTVAASAPVKWGRRDSREAADFFYSSRIELPDGDGPHHAIRVLQGFPKALGVDAEVTIPLQLKSGPRFAWSSFFCGDPNLQFIVFSDSRGPGKEWPKFEALSRLIWQHVPGSRVAWCAEQAATPQTPPPAGRFLNLTGCPFVEMLELCRQSSIFIGNDSGPMHLSAAMGNKVLAIFGASSPLRFAPWPIGSSRTQVVQAPGGVLANLTPEEVLWHLLRLSGRH